MRRILGLVAVAIVVLPAPAGAGAVDAPADDLREWFDDLAGTPPDGIELMPVTDVNTVDAVTGAPAEGQLPNLMPLDFATFRLDGPPGFLRDLLDLNDRDADATSEFGAAAADAEAAVAFVVRLSGPIDLANGSGININFDRDPNVDGLKLDGAPTPGDCAIDVFEGAGQRSVMSSVVREDGEDFVPVAAPAFRLFAENGGLILVPDDHPCLDAPTFSPSAYGVAGRTAIKHQVPFVPFNPSRIVVTGAAGPATPAPVAGTPDEEDEGGGVNPLLIGGIILAAGGLLYGGYRIFGGKPDDGSDAFPTIDTGDSSGGDAPNLPYLYWPEPEPISAPPVDPERLARVEYAFRLLDSFQVEEAQALIREVLEEAQAEHAGSTPVDPTTAEHAKAVVEHVAETTTPDASVTVDLKELGGRVTTYIDALVPPVTTPPLLSQEEIDAALHHFAPPGSEDEAIMNMARKQREAGEWTPEEEASALGHLLDDADVRDAVNAAPDTGSEEVPDSLKLRTDPKAPERSVLDDIPPEDLPPVIS